MKTPHMTFAVMAMALISHAPLAGAEQAPEADTDLLDFRQAQRNAPTEWVDPQIANRKQCFDRPGRPKWLVNQPPGMEWRRMLIEQYVHLQARRALVESGDCSCENVYPDYADYQAEIDQLYAQFPNTREEFDAEDSDLLSEMTRTMRRRASQLAVEAGRLCRDF